MTGEITIYGDVLEVGGIQEKVIAARNQKIKKLFLPKTNQAQFEEIPEYVRKDLDIQFVSHYSEVYSELF